MDQGNLSQGEQPTESAPHVPPEARPDHAGASTVTASERPGDRLALLQHAYLLEQLTAEGAGSKSAGELNKKITAAAKRELQLSPDVANRVRRELAEHHHLEVNRQGQTVRYALTEAGRSYLAGLERPTLKGRTNRAATVDEATISDEVREAQKAYLLLQLLDADGQPVSKGDANRIPRSLAVSLGLTPAVANYRRAKMAEQHYLRIAVSGRSEQYALTPDGLDYLAAGARQLGHASITLKGKTLNALVTAARESSFERGQPAGPTPAAQQAPSREELAAAVLAAFQELRRERHGRSGLVPIHEVRRRIADRFGAVASRHDVLDEVILGLWRQQRLGLEAISDLSDATAEQLDDSIAGVHGTLFYLEAAREQAVASEPL
jgi:hypothetical protein